MRKKMWKKFLPITMAVVIFATSMPVDALANTVSQNTVTQEEQTQNPMPATEVVDANTDGTTGDLLDGTTIVLNDVTLKATYKEEGSSTTTVVNITDGGEFELPYNADINMRLNFTLADGNAIEAGKSYVYKLPDSIRVDVEADHELEDGSGKSIGKVHISQDGTLTFQYYADVLANNTDVDFYVQFEGGLSEDLQESGKEVDITFPTASGDFDFTINTTDSTENTEDPEPKDISMQKSGAQIVNANGQKVIEWTIELGPEGRDTLDGTIVDVLPAGLTYVSGSATLVDAYEGSISTPVVDGQKLTIEVNDVKTYYHAKVKFQTTYDDGFGPDITNSTSMSVNNDAIFNPSDGTTGVTDGGKVTVVPDVVSKTGTAIDANGDITWTVVLNREQLDLQGATYTDTIGPGLALNGGISINPSNGANVTTTANGFTVEFASGTPVNDTYTITYKTSVEDYTVQSFKNTAALTGGDIKQYNVSKEAVVPGMNLLDKAYTSFNTVTNTFTWTITVNKENIPLRNVVVTDSFLPGEMEFISASVAYSALDEVNGKVTFELGDISTTQTITIVTRIKNPESLDKTTYYQFINNAELTSTDINVPVEDSADTWIQVKEPELISKKGEIKDGVIEWTVTVNQPQLTVEEMVLSDVLPAKTEYIPGTFRIQNLWYDANPVYVEPIIGTNGVGQETISYTMQPSDPAQAEFMQKSFWFVYRTKITDTDMANDSASSYTNAANISVTYEGNVTVDDDVATTVTGKVGGVVDKTYSYKSGDQTVTWDIAINQGRNDMSSIQNPKISDQLADYFDYVSGTLYLVDAQGNETAVDRSEYIVSTVNNKIIVQLPKDADNKYLGTNCYIFRFTTRFNVLAAELEGKKITNTANFVGQGGGYTTESDVVNNVSFSSSSAGAVVKREVRVRKVDATTGLPLANAKFELYLGDECIGEATSDANGDAVFEDMNSVIGYTIKLKEVQAPDGYVLDPTPRDIVFTEENLITQSGVDYYEVEIPNTAEAAAVTGAINIRKEDANGNLLNGAVFGLYSDSACTTLVKSRTATDGTLAFTDLAEGTYYVKEISSPAGYKVSDEMITAVITNGGGSAVVTYNSSTRGDLGQASVVSITNEKATGSLKITKQDKDDASPIDGATFSIYKDANCTDRVATAITSSGVLTFSGLELGRTYYYRETAAPSGYVLDTTIHQITIGDGTEVEDQLEEVVVKNTKELGNIVIYKIDDSATPVRLSGVEFALYQSNGITPVLDSSSNPYVVTTDDEGKAAFSNLPFGDYVIREVAAPEGYVASTDTTVTVKQLGDTEVTIINKKIVVDIKVYKEGPDASDTMGPLAGAEFGLYKSNGVQMAKGTTDANGELYFHDIPYGDYYVQELKAPVGYNIKDAQQDISKTELETAYRFSGGIHALSFDNDRQNGSIQITKVDDQDNVLPDAEFTLYDENMLPVNIAGVTNPVISDALGFATFTGLPYGTYYVQETEAPAGYVRDPKVYKVIVDSDTTVTEYTKDDDTKENLKIENIEAESPFISFKIKKTDSETDLPLANAVFELYKDGVAYSPAVTAVTGADGIAYFRRIEIKDDIDGTEYSVREVSAPTGYKLDPTVYVLGKHGTDAINKFGDPLSADPLAPPLTDAAILYIDGQIQDNMTTPVENDPLKGSVKVTKTALTASTLLAGAQFTLYDENRNVVSIAGLTNPGTTDANGVVTFTNLPVGIYYLKETKAPKGYTLNTTETKIVVTDETVHEVTYKDTPINVSISKKAVGGDTEIVGAVFKIYKASDANKTAVDSWTTTGNIHRVLVGALEVGETYVLTEMIAPTGYGYMADQQFKVNEDGSITVLTGGLEKTGQTLVVRDKQVKLAISKIDKDTDAPLAGAILGIYDENGVEVDRFTSTTISYDVPLGKLTAPAFNTDGSVAYKQYTLKEISAPDGYQLADDIVFAVDSNGKVYTAQITGNVTNYTEITGNNPTITMEDEEKPSGTIYIRKLNAKTSLDIKGATLGIYDATTDVLVITVNPNGTPVAMTCGSGSGFDLQFDTDYVLKETTVPAGYLQADDIRFRVETTGEITILQGSADNLNGDKDTLMMRDQELELKIRKQDSFGQVLNGAVLTVSEYDPATGTVGDEIIEFTSGGGAAQNILSKDLKVGQSYVLHEVSAPDGYHKAADIVFTIQADGSLVRTDGVQVYNNTIVMEDDEAGLSIGKVSLNTGRGLAGSTLELTSQDDPHFTTQTWVSDGTNRTWELTEFTPGCTYTLTELKAPLGYALTDPIVFTIDATDHQIYINGELAANRTVHIADGKLELAVNKLDFYSKENVKGAKLGVYDTNGNLITSWTSGAGKIWIDASKMVVQANDYQEYILREIEAPTGYKKADDIHFAFDRDGKVYLVTEDAVLGTKQYDEVDDKTLVMYDEPYIRVEKVGTDGNPVVGAKLEITAKNDASFKTVTWTTDGKPYWFADGTFKEGVTYVLTELAAPAGYVVAEPVEFTVDADNNLYVKGQKVLNRRIVMIDQKVSTGGVAGSAPIVGTVNTTLPKTGDGTPIGTLMLFMAFGFFGACMTFGGYLRRKYRKSE